MFELNKQKSSSSFAGRVSSDDSYDVVRTYSQATSERNLYDLIFEFVYPLAIAFFVASAIAVIASITHYFSFVLFFSVLTLVASVLYLVVFVMHTTKDIAFSESEKYKQIAKVEKKLGQSLSSEAQVKCVRLELSENENGCARMRYIDFPGIDDKQLLGVAVHCLSNGNSFSKHSLDGIISTTQYPRLCESFKLAGFVRDVDGRGTKELTPSAKHVLKRYIQAI